MSGRDLRGSELFEEAKRAFRYHSDPRFSSIVDISEVQRSSSPSQLLVTATVRGLNDQPAVTRIFEFDIEKQTFAPLSSGPNSDRHARISPDGGTIAFLSDRDGLSDFQLYLLDVRSSELATAPKAEGWVEYFEWSPDGRRILLGVAAHGAELSSGEGAYTAGGAVEGLEPWMPELVHPGSDSLRRELAIFDLDADALTKLEIGAGNVWEAGWCGPEKLAAVVSADPEEGAWYSSELKLIDLAARSARTLHTPARQIASPRGSASGRYLAFLESIASDRGFVAGDLTLHDCGTGDTAVLPTCGVDIAHIEWRSDRLLLASGHRGLETVVLLIDVPTRAVQELWVSEHLTASGNYAVVTGLGQPADFALIREGFFDPPHIAVVVGGEVRSFGPDRANPAEDEASRAEIVIWQAPDGLTIEGWLLRPREGAPHPTILAVHDGPVFHWRPHWIGRAPWMAMLLRRGFAIFLPNMRGSSGRGEDFAARIIGDVGGADAQDLLCGLDFLISSGVADPRRLGVTGLSYGGLMTCWLTTQDRRFKAAAAVGPATNHVSHHLSCNMPQFVRLFLQDHYTRLEGAYYARSPVLHAHKSRTPTLLVCGRQDRCTPAEEAMQFHTALVENGVESLLVMYPEEGHGVRSIPALFDFSARLVAWLTARV